MAPSPSNPVERRAMRFNLRLHGSTEDGKQCRAEISVYAVSGKDLEREALKASENAAWYFVEGDQDWLPEGGQITVERVEDLGRKCRGTGF